MSGKLPSTLERSAPLRYADVGFFFLSVFLVAMISRIAVHVRALAPSTLDDPSLPLQVAVSLYLIGSLYVTVRLRHGQGAWGILGWSHPAPRYVVAALLGGAGLGMVVDSIARATTSGTHLIHLWNLILLDGVLGPVVEETFFRGCLLPVVARTTGPLPAVLITAALFATLHPERTVVQWACFSVTGTAFGWIRVKSGSTTAAALMHAVYNASLFFCQNL